MNRAWVRLLATVCMACAGDVRAVAPYELQVRVLTDTGDAVADAALSRDGVAIGSTGANGSLSVRVAGNDGQRVQFSATCPTGFRPHHARQQVALRRVAALRESPLDHMRTVTMTCLPGVRRGVLVVRVSGATRVPVLVDAKVVAHTNQYGVAHVALALVPASSLRVSLDTSAFPKLVPASPSERFAIEDRDAILVFDQALAEVKRPRRRAKRSRVRDVPYRLD